MEKKVSIIIPTYNSEKYIDECLKSIIKQNYKNLQIIVVNDGSTDDSLKIIEKYQKQDNRILIYNQENAGPSRARNIGLNIANGEYVAFIDSDDYVEENMISDMVTFMQQEEADICMCGYYVCNDEKNIYSNIPEKRVLESKEALRRLLIAKETQNFLCNKIFKLKLFNNIRLPEGELYEDIAVLYKIFEKSKKIVYLNDALYYYRQHSESITNKMNENKCIEFIKQIEKRNAYLKEKYPDLSIECEYNSILVSIYVIQNLLKLNQEEYANKLRKKIIEKMKIESIRKEVEKRLPQKNKKELDMLLSETNLKNLIFGQ